MDKYDLILTIIQWASPILLALLGWGGTELVKLIRAKTKNSLVAGALERLVFSVETVVRSIDQVLVDAIRMAKAEDSEGGSKITEDERRLIKNAATRELRSYYGARGWGELAKVLGLDSGGLADMTEGLIERKVKDLKLEKAKIVAIAGNL